MARFQLRCTRSLSRKLSTTWPVHDSLWAWYGVFSGYFTLWFHIMMAVELWNILYTKTFLFCSLCQGLQGSDKTPWWKVLLHISKIQWVSSIMWQGTITAKKTRSVFKPWLTSSSDVISSCAVQSTVSFALGPFMLLMYLHWTWWW